jgi:hypothetical protein
MLMKIFIYMVIFFLLASPGAFRTVRGVLGGWVASAEGVPTSAGLVLHSAVYVLLACYLPAKLLSKYAEEFGDYYAEEMYEDEKYAEEMYEDEKYRNQAHTGKRARRGRRARVGSIANRDDRNAPVVGMD